MKNPLLFLSLLLLLSSCEKENAGNEEPGPGINEEIEFFPEETYWGSQPQIPKLLLKFQTKKIFRDACTGLSTTLILSGDDMIVRFDSFYQAGGCALITSPAKVQFVLPENIKRLTLVNGKKIDTYTLTINDEFVTINSIKREFSELKVPKLFRYPKNSFVYSCGTSTNNTHHYQDFLSILYDSTDLKEFFFDGSGKIPYRDSSEGSPTKFKTHFFRYEREQEFDKAGELLKRYSEKNIVPFTGAYIFLTNWQNKTLKH